MRCLNVRQTTLRHPRQQSITRSRAENHDVHDTGGGRTCRLDAQQATGCALVFEFHFESVGGQESFRTFGPFEANHTAWIGEAFVQAGSLELPCSAFKAVQIKVIQHACARTIDVLEYVGWTGDRHRAWSEQTARKPADENGLACTQFSAQRHHRSRNCRQRAERLGFSGGDRFDEIADTEGLGYQRNTLPSDLPSGSPMQTL